MTATKPWVIGGSDISFWSGNVGIGTATPQARLDVASGNGSYVRVDNTHGDLHGNGGVDGAFGLYNDSGPTGRIDIIGGGNSLMALLHNGNVGIGAPAPTTKLDVRGDVKLGTTGQYFATGGAENLRVVRGTVSSDGNIYFGSGFSVFHGTLGIYDIAFSAPFPAAPTITATVEYSGGAPLFAMTYLVNPSGVRILLINHAGAPVDGIFHFTAIGTK